MSYKRYKCSVALSKPDKVDLMSEYIDYYKQIIDEQGLGALNVKIEREIFADVLDEIGSLLNQKSAELANASGPVKNFLKANPLPPHMKGLLPDDFRVFSLLLNALKQWVSAESQSTDRYLLGGTSRATCKEAVDMCIVTGGELGDRPELHHPLRDGRPPILISKEGHDLVEHGLKKLNFEVTGNSSEDETWNAIKQLRTKKRQSWAQLREGCNSIISGSNTYRPGAKSFANVIIRETGLSAREILNILDDKAL